MSAKTKAQLLAEIEALKKRLAEPHPAEVESHQKNDTNKKQGSALGERLKELNCLYGISNLVETPGISLPDILQGCVEFLPLAWQYPQITCTRITLDNQEYKTKNFQETKWKLASEIKVEGKAAGSVEVFYLEKQPKSDQGPFLKEERVLIDAVAERLGRVIQRVWAQERVDHLALVLRAVRNVNQLIIREKNRGVLIHEICDTLIETRGYSTAWIMLLDERGRYLDSAESSLGKGFTPLLKELKRGDFPACVRQALKQPSPAEITDPSSTCADCPITDKYSDKGRMTIQLDHAEKIYGVLSVSFGVDITVDEEELSLFDEVAGDIAFALSNIELEGKREQAVEELKNSEQFVSDVFNAIQDGISVLNTELTIIGTNKWMEEMYSDKMPLTGKKCYQVYQGRKSICPWCPSEQTLENGKMHLEVVPYPNNENPIGWIELSSYPLIDNNGKITGVIEYVKDITERVLAKRALQESAEYQKAIFETTSLPTIIIEEDTTLSMVNKEFEKLSGYSKEELEGKMSWTEFVAAEDLKRMKDLHRQRRINPAAAIKQYKFQFINRNGIVRNILLHVDMILGTKQSVASLLDITEQVQSEQEIEMLLALSRQASAETSLDDLLFLITDQIVEVITPAETASIFFYDEERDVIRIQAWAGFTDSEIKGLEFSIEDSQVGRILRTKKPTLIKDVSTSADFKSIDKPSLIGVKSQIAVPLIFKKRVIGIMFADNLTRTDAFSQKNLDLLESIGNQLAGVIENMHLLDQVRDNHKQLSQSEQNFRDLIDNSPYGIVIADEQGKHLYVNQKTSLITGYSSEELLNLSIEDITPPEELAKLKKRYLDRIGGEPVPDQYERLIVRKDGTTVLTELNTTVTMWEGNKCGMAIIHDITERKRVEEELKTSEERFRAFMENVPAFAYILNKDLQHIYGNPASIAADGYSSLDDYIGTSIQDSYPDEISDEINANSLRVLSEGYITRYEFTISEPDGQFRTILDTKFPIELPDGSSQVGGLAIDITDMKEAQKKEQRHLDNIAFLSETAMQFVNFPPQEDIYRFIGERLKELSGESIVVVNSIDSAKGILATRAVVGMEKHSKRVLDLIGRNPEGMEFDANDESLAYLIDGQLHDDREGLYELFLGTVPKPVCRTMENLFRLNKIYTMGFVQNLRLFGTAVILLTQGAELESVETIKLFIEQASIAIQRRQVELALHQERDKAQKYLDIAEVMILAIDKEGEITLVNQKGASILGYQIEELIGKNWFNICVPPADRKQAKKIFDEFIAGGVALGGHFEQIILTKTGEERVIDWHSTPLWVWDDGVKHRIGSLNSGEDITKSKLADEKLRQSEEQYYSVVEDSPGLINRFTPDGTIIFVNQKYCQFFGKESDELIGTNIQSTIPEEDRESVMSNITSLTKESPIQTSENRSIRHDGEICWTRWTDCALFDNAGQKIRIQSFGQDVTEIVEVENRLRLEQAKAQKYLDIARVAFVALNKKGEITLINQKGRQILGYEEDELTGVNWFDTCLPERNRKEVKRVFKNIMTGDDELVEFYENPVLTKSGEERIIAWHNTVIKDEKGNNIGTLASGEDITERVWAEQLLDALNRAAVSMGTAQTPQEIFNAVAEQLKQLDISCMLFPIDDTQGKLITKYISYESAVLNTAEKLVGIKHEDFSFPIDAVDMYMEVVRNKKTLFIDDSEQAMQQILPEIPKKLLAKIIKLLRVQKSISAPLIVEGQVIGVFSAQSDKLTQEDIPTATAFADQLSSAWNKIELLQNLRKTMEGAIHTIAATVEARDPYTAGHQIRVADLAAAIASEMHLSDEQVEGIRMAGTIHDLGKVQVPAEILSKPGKISELEYKIIQTHPQVGFDLLKGIEFPWPIAQMVLQHHEMMDGSGYPHGLKDEEIMLEARILAVADTVEAMSSHRPYRPALGVEKALNQIKQDKGTLFDPDVVDACLKIFEDGYKLPTG